MTVTMEFPGVWRVRPDLRRYMIQEFGVFDFESDTVRLQLRVCAATLSYGRS